MRVGERGQVTIPKNLRERFGIRAGASVEFQEIGGNLILRKSPRKPGIRKWKGRGQAFASLGNVSVDKLIEDLRGR